MRKSSTELLGQGTQTPSPASDLIPAETKNSTEDSHSDWYSKRGHLTPTSRCHRLYGFLFSADFATGRGGLLQLLSTSLPSCCCCNPARVPRRFGQFATSHVPSPHEERLGPWN